MQFVERNRKAMHAPYEKPLMSVRWADIHEVFAFKHDLFCVDAICLGFCIDETGHLVSFDFRMI